MSYLFNLWNFFLIFDNACEFDVTIANMPRIKDCTVEWIEECISTFGPRVSVRMWEIKPFRSLFFSDYVDSEDWRDRWPQGWIIHAVIDNGATLPENDLINKPNHIDLLDPTWNYGFVDPRHDNTALLISNHTGELSSIKELAKEIILESKLEGKLDVEIQTSIRSFGNNKHQLRIILNNNIFPDYVDTLEELLDFCRRRNGNVNWRETI